ncbi:hypothetical protein GCM10019016_103690 [Streptomyces prasinosporus]|uniref:Transposase n=1 Tax=Streptomyces prasinosporus TaxID=68256 RepID=A0ABP6U8K8_9ACTN
MEACRSADTACSGVTARRRPRDGAEAGVGPSPVDRARRGCDSDKHRHLLRKRGIKPMITRRGVPHGSGLGKVRRVVEHPSPGSTSSNASASAMNAERGSTKACSSSPAA